MVNSCQLYHLSAQLNSTPSFSSFSISRLAVAATPIAVLCVPMVIPTAVLCVPMVFAIAVLLAPLVFPIAVF